MTLTYEPNKVLITGGSEGIGLALAIRFLHAGDDVIITGRSTEKLDRIAKAHPGLLTFAHDVGDPVGREALAAFIGRDHPDLNIVINNAGIQRRISLAEDDAPWAERQKEIDILLSGPVHLNHLLIPFMLAHGRSSTIANVTSGGAYIPQPFAPIYSACKAALHSYTFNLRFALADTTCRVVEIIPPAVRTALAGPSATHGVPLDEFCDAIFDGLNQRDHLEIGYGMTATNEFEAAGEPYRAMFDSFSGRFPVKRYKR